LAKSFYRAEPLSRNDLRRYAFDIRKELKIENIFRFPVMNFLEFYPEIIGEDDFYYAVVDENDLPPGVHADYSLEHNCIRIRQSVYDGACNGIGRDRMTVMHEMSHALLLKISGVKLQRNYSETLPTYCDPEWQAKCLAGEIMIPAHLVRGMKLDEVVQRCGVSYDAASYQLSKIK
jgi:Zn-dependent peptidase ImmA (M78 family)